MDTGSLAGNIINCEMERKLRAAGVVFKEDCKLLRTGIGGSAVASRYSTVINYKFINELTSSYEQISLNIRTAPGYYDLIIGLEDIRNHDLVLKRRSHFTSGKQNKAQSL